MVSYYPVYLKPSVWIVLITGYTNVVVVCTGIQPIQAQQLMLTWAIFTVCIINTIKK